MYFVVVHESKFFKLFLIYTPQISVFCDVISEVSLMFVFLLIFMICFAQKFQKSLDYDVLYYNSIDDFNFVGFPGSLVCFIISSFPCILYKVL